MESFYVGMLYTIRRDLVEVYVLRALSPAEALWCIDEVFHKDGMRECSLHLHASFVLGFVSITFPY